MSYSNALNRGANVLIGYVFGSVYLLVGLLGFTVSGGHDFAGMDGGKLLGLFMVNPLHNVAHLLIGALLVLAATRGEAVSSRVNTVVGGVYLLLGLVGLFILNEDVNILALNTPDNILHFGSAAILLGAGLSAGRRTSATV
ncbi:MAG TPA: DUF4383 domain-containing protein [Mycobacteriales bacterium]|nr:DUF4383 domain-containing protein [Mycobacteriales bacterium]